MSDVTNIILYIGALFDDEETKMLQEVNAFFIDKDNAAYSQNGFVSIDDASLPRGWYGGNKMLEASLFVGAFNGLYLEEFIKHIQSITWEYPEDVQLIIKEDGESKFRIIDVFDDMPQARVVRSTIEVPALELDMPLGIGVERFLTMINGRGLLSRCYAEPRHSGSLGSYTTDLIDVCKDGKVLATYDTVVTQYFTERSMAGELDDLIKEKADES